MLMLCRAGRRGSLEVDGYTSDEGEAGGLLTGLNTSGNLYIGIIVYTALISFTLTV